MCSFIKKTATGALLGVAALGLIFGTDAGSYLKTAFCSARDNIKGSVPIDFEINRLRQQANDLEHSMRGQIQWVAQQEDEVKGLKTDLVANREKLAKEEKTIVSLRGMLEGAETRLASNGPTFSPEEVKADLATKFSHYQRLEKIVQQQQSTLTVREKQIADAHKALELIKTRKMEMLARLDAIETQIRANEASDVPNAYPFDKSALADLESSIKDLEKRTELQTREQELTNRYLSTPTAADSAVNTDPELLNQIDAKFPKNSDSRDTNL